MSDHDGFFDDKEPARVDGRYRLPHPETGKEQSWTAATTHAELPEDSFALTRYQLRMLLLGLRERPDVLRMLEASADQPDNAQLDEWIATAHGAMATDEKANRGTAIHGVLQQVDRAWNRETGAPDPAVLARLPEWAAPYVSGYLGELERQGLTPIPTMTERRVVNLALGCAGTLDNLYEEADATIALGDKKTGRLDYPERKYAIQLAVYGHADYMVEANDTWIDLRSVGVRQDYAVLIHIDPETGACSTYRVDLRRGQYGANLAADVRAWRKERGLLLPYVPPGVPAADWRPAGERHLAVVREDVKLHSIDQHGNPAFTVNPPPADGSSPAKVGKPPAVVGEPPSPWLGPAENIPVGPESVGPGTFAESGGLAPGEGVVTWTTEQLEKFTKADLQGILRRIDPGATVNHQRKILARKILTLQSGGTVSSTTPKVTGKDPAELPPGPATTGAEDPTDPRSPAFHRARLAEIAQAPSVGTLGRIHSFVLRVGGEQAWTDDLTEAARKRVAELDAAEHWNAKEVSTASLVKRVSEATSSEEIGAIWNEVTVGGSAPDRWTPQLIDVGNRRLREVTQPAPVANPYAPGYPEIGTTPVVTP